MWSKEERTEAGQERREGVTEGQREGGRWTRVYGWEKKEESSEVPLEGSGWLMERGKEVIHEEEESKE